MNVALMGSVSSSWHALDAMIRGGIEVTAVLGLDETLADRVSDYRSLRDLAERIGAPFLSFLKVGEPAVESFLRSHPPDLLWVIGLSQLVPRGLVRIAHSGGVGFHPTLLPKGRGRAPVAWTILLNEPAAANLFFLADEPDAGDIIMQRPVAVEPDDYSEDLIRRTNHVLADMILELAPLIRAGSLPRTPQDHSQATYYPRRTLSDGEIDWNQPTEMIYRLVRAAGRPYHGAFTELAGERIIIWRAHPEPASELPGLFVAGRPGTILHVDSTHGVRVRTNDGVLRLTDIAFGSMKERRIEATIKTGGVMGRSLPPTVQGKK